MQFPNRTFKVIGLAILGWALRLEQTREVSACMENGTFRKLPNSIVKLRDGKLHLGKYLAMF